MFFTRIGKFLAHLLFWFALIRIAVAIGIASISHNMEMNRAASQRYLGTETTGEAINGSVKFLLIGLGLGVLCEMSRRSAKRVADKAES